MRLACIITALAIAGCGEPSDSDPGVDAGDGDGDGDGDVSSDPLEGLPTGADQWRDLCARGHADAISAAVCAGSAPPVLGSLADVRALLGLEIVGPASAATGNPAFAVASHSTAIGMRHVNEINPRVVIFTPPLGALNPSTPMPNPDYTILAFSRGEPFVELAAKDQVTGEPRFYLIRFDHPCEDQPGGCSNGDLYTQTIEQGWSGTSIYDDEAIGNTTLDCLQCHQPGGPGSGKMLRMQEFQIYWNHWFFNESPEQNQVRADFGAAHAGESSYGGLPIESFTGVRLSTPAHLQALLQHNGFAQPNHFPSIQIDQEMAQNGTSPTWDALYAESVAGREIATPHWATSPSDRALLDSMIAAYQDVLSGSSPGTSLPDITRTIPESQWADMSIRPAPGLDGRGIMTHICRHCHNSQLDPSISRAGFDVDQLDSLPRSVKDEAIARLMRPDDDRRRMPPSRFHELSDAERDLVIQELSR